MRTTINALWHSSLTLWQQRCHEFHGHNGVLSQEALWKDALSHAMTAYNDTYEHNPTPAHPLLHRRPVGEMINWTKQDLDAYLAMVEMACEWCRKKYSNTRMIVVFPILQLSTRLVERSEMRESSSVVPTEDESLQISVVNQNFTPIGTYIFRCTVRCLNYS
jgi:hypothetical protein